MRNTLIFSGTSCPDLSRRICESLGMAPASAELTQFSNGETSVRILTSTRDKDVFVVQSGSPRINDTIMELLIMISACKGGSASKITAVLPYFPYNRQSKKKSHRGAITARMLANLLHVAGVKHVITVDLHASQMQGFFQCPVDNLHAEPLIARWIRLNVPNWKEAVVVSKNAGGTKRVTSLADALKLNFGMVTTDKKRGHSMTASMILNHMDDPEMMAAMLEARGRTLRGQAPEGEAAKQQIEKKQESRSRVVADSSGSPRRASLRTSNANTNRRSSRTTPRPSVDASVDSATAPAVEATGDVADDEADQFNDDPSDEVTHARLVQGHIVPDDFPSPATSAADTSLPEDDPMMMSHASSFFQPDNHALGGPGDAGSSDEEEDKLKDPKIEHMITLVGNVRNRTVFIVDDMMDKPGSWIAAAETVVKRGGAEKVYCIATHGVFGADCLEQLEACDCIHRIVVTDSYPIRPDKASRAKKLVVLDLSQLLAEAIRRNHHGESISPLFQHILD
ncbi:ribose-phosphate pyrophosphokinase 1 [Gaeumannomyces tritici R3-111a-1]|uniref:Ribose-phosphate pyrophosphokinase 1 n=1 Tax=Gaeumannomyces tritici (strain R3-111a-1) TaxID=644352 RepID=J3P5L2_GAET3|nr:ribose-phosphate pyrophosphokinase 1 [Gaeumannomyces tritici R3-111a-1]EJT74964.1 ribose-phosphate pyrophosphokinase 1 [Gaeumannomyces tritici R3-111a-1]